MENTLKKFFGDHIIEKAAEEGETAVRIRGYMPRLDRLAMDFANSFKNDNGKVAPLILRKEIAGIFILAGREGL